MNLTKFYTFNFISDLTIKEKFGPFIVTIQPGSLCKFDALCPTNRIHHHSYYELCFVIEGEGEYFHDQQLYPLQKGDIFICHPEVDHEIRLKSQADDTSLSELYLIFFTLQLEQIKTDVESPLTHYESHLIHSFLNHHQIVVSHGDHLFSYIDFLVSHQQHHHPTHYGLYQMIKTMALEGLSLLCSHSAITFETNSYPNEFNQLLLFIEENLNRSITIKELANLSFMSHRNIHYLFNKYMSKTPKDYINERKIHLAKLYLKMNYKVGDVALLVGINDFGQFSRLFKKYCGISPKTFQNET